MLHNVCGKTTFFNETSVKWVVRLGIYFSATGMTKTL